MTRNKILAVLGVLAILVLAVAPAKAALSLGGDSYVEIDGLFTDPVGMTFGSYMQGSEAYGYNYDPTTLGAYSSPTGSFATNGNARDHYWLQDIYGGVDFGGYSGNIAEDGIWFDLGGQANKVVVFPSIDHGPLPSEALEHTVWLSNDLSMWTRANLETTYKQGWAADPIIADGWVGVYSGLSGGTWRYASVTWGGPSSIWADGDTEIDAVAGLTEQNGGLNPVPEPGTMVLLGMGLAGIAARRRRKANNT